MSSVVAVAQDAVCVTADRKLYDVVAASVLRRQICGVEESEAGAL